MKYDHTLTRIEFGVFYCGRFVLSSVYVLTVDSSAGETLLSAVGPGRSAGGAEGRSTSQ